MNTKYTTLILGAGTSVDYGYPSGADLVKQIGEHLLTHKEGGSHLFKDLKDNSPYSIDAFLKEFPKHDLEAKAIIAEILFRCENPDIHRNSEDLYRYLFHNIPRNDYQNYKIITFNYDRSLEYYFAQHLRPSVEYPGAAFKVLSELEIIHIHGRLPPLAGETEDPALFREPSLSVYGAIREQRRGKITVPSDDPPRNLPRPPVIQSWQEDLWMYGRKSFKTVYQNNDINQEAKDILEQSSRIFFLGFSYHELNMKLLGLDWIKPDPSRLVAGTCFRMSPVAKATARKHCPIITMRDCSAFQFFQHHYSLSDPDLVL